jgi:hypothetical protein
MRNMKLFFRLILMLGMVVSGASLADPGHGGRAGHGHAGAGHGHGGYGHGGYGHGGYGHGHFGFGLYLGMPYSYPYYPYPYDYYPYSYYPPVVAVPSQSPVYVEQGDAQLAPQQVPAAQAGNYWYHCDQPEGYYPYIKECPGGWQRVSPTPPPQP